ncbi:MAG: hypothetical protein R2762_12465 [Bryobacteraceae bacterium]
MASQDDTGTRIVRETWTPMTVRFVGTIAGVVKGGGGKLSTTGGDQGDSRKPSGQG